MTRTKIKTETKTDTGRSTGTRGGRSLSAGQGMCEFGRNHGILLSDMLCLSYYGEALAGAVVYCKAGDCFIMAEYLNVYAWIRR